MPGATPGHSSTMRSQGAFALNPPLRVPWVASSLLEGYCAAGKVLGRATTASITTGLLLNVSITILPARMPE